MPRMKTNKFYFAVTSIGDRDAICFTEVYDRSLKCERCGHVGSYYAIEAEGGPLSHVGACAKCIRDTYCCIVELDKQPKYIKYPTGGIDRHGYRQGVPPVLWDDKVGPLSKKAKPRGA